jgi:hypothetical protein
MIGPNANHTKKKFLHNLIIFLVYLTLNTGISKMGISNREKGNLEFNLENCEPNLVGT